MSAPTKGVRAMRSRRSGMLACGHFVQVGSLIARVDGQWICGPCRLGQLRELADIMSEPAQPSERGGTDNTDARRGTAGGARWARQFTGLAVVC